MSFTTVASFDSLSQGYGKRLILDSLDLQVERGVTGLLGPNGAGKTTLLQTLSTITPPRSGRLSLFGDSISTERDVRQVRRRIGYLPQEFGYYPSFSVNDFVAYCAWLREVPSRRITELTRKAVADVGLADRGKTKMKSLSGGMLRRAGIAAAIVGYPSLVLLDEPTVGLDPAQRLEFRRLIRSIASQGAAVMLSTHLVEDVAAACDTVLVLKEGAIAFNGSPQELVNSAVSGAQGDSPLECGYMSVLGNLEPSGEQAW